MRFASATPPVETLAMRAWNMMGQQLDWSALPVIAELFGIDDVEEFSDDILCIRDHLSKSNG